jgi:serine/threonine protein kinase/WD40 repeat protein
MLSSREPDFFLEDWRVRPQLNVLEGPDGDTVTVEPRAMETLVCLARRPGKVVRKERLIAEVWGETFVTEGVLTQAIWQLRQAFGDDPKEPRFIQTVPRRGYRLVARVSRLEAPPKAGARTVGPYRVGEKLGGGAMGTVHRAEDTRLRRPVALKFLAPELVRDPDTQARFLREARAASALDHPHICTVHDIGESDDGEVYLAMAYYEGETLKKCLERGPLPVTEALAVAAQIAEGLAAAHARGIVHRDLKPANVFLTSEGTVKLLDFGLAKLTDTTLLTVTGRPLGTPAYMAPEQARGETVDHRADLWALGVVLYQMLTGELPFGGESSNAILYAIAHEEPRSLGEGIELPPGIADLLESLLRKDPAERYSDSAALPNALLGVTTPRVSPARLVTTVERRRKSFLPSVATGLVAILAATAGWWILAGRAPETPAEPLTFTPVTTDRGWKARPHLSPDGEKVTYEWAGPGSRDQRIWVKLLGADTSPVRLTGHPAVEVSPVWSPDGREIAFVRLEENAAIYVKPWLGGRERKLADIVGPVISGYLLPTLSWSPDGGWLAFAEKSDADKPARIVRLSLETGEKQPLTLPPEGALGDLFPEFSPDGSQIAFARGPSGVWAGLDLWVQPVGDGPARRLTSGQFDGFGGLAWTANGREIVFTTGTGWEPGARVFRLSLEGGEPRPVQGVGGHSGAISIRGARMVYTESTVRPSDIWISPGRRVAPRDRIPEKLIASSAFDQSPAVSPDGKKIAFTSYRSGTANIWVASSDGTNPVQLTRCKSHCGTPNWSPDGRWIVFDSLESGNWDLYVVDAEGGLSRQLTFEPSDDGTPSWSRDGGWIYLHSDRGGDHQIWKTTATGGETVQVTRGGGFYARESWDGRHLYYANSHKDPGIWRMPVEGGEEIEVVAGPLPSFSDWALSRSGIYYVTCLHHQDVGDWRGLSLTGTIHFFDFESGQATNLIQREGVRGLRWVAPSPDEEWILYVELHPEEADLVLVENFR